MSERAYRRLQRDERRELLLERATELFAQHGYDGLSMSQLAREAQISKALLYHYFPSKRRLFEAALEEGAEELRARTEPEPGRPPAEQLATTLDAFLQWVQERPTAYATLLRERRRARCARSWPRSARRPRRGSSPASARTAQRPATRAAVHGWLGFLDGAILDWIAHDDLSREELHGMLLGAFAGALHRLRRERRPADGVAADLSAAGLGLRLARPVHRHVVALAGDDRVVLAAARRRPTRGACSARAPAPRARPRRTSAR